MGERQLDLFAQPSKRRAAPKVRRGSYRVIVRKAEHKKPIDTALLAETLLRIIDDLTPEERAKLESRGKKRKRAA
jgi:hypothetical protein